MGTIHKMMNGFLGCWNRRLRSYSRIVSGVVWLWRWEMWCRHCIGRWRKGGKMWWGIRSINCTIDMIYHFLFCKLYFLWTHWIRLRLWGCNSLCLYRNNPLLVHIHTQQLFLRWTILPFLLAVFHFCPKVVSPRSLFRSRFVDGLSCFIGYSLQKLMNRYINRYYRVIVSSCRWVGWNKMDMSEVYLVFCNVF